MHTFEVRQGGVTVASASAKVRVHAKYMAYYFATQYLKEEDVEIYEVIRLAPSTIEDK